MRVVLAGGGTAGHIEPALALADALRRRDPAVEIVLLGTSRGLETRLVPARGYALALIPAVPVPRRPSLDLLRLPARVHRSVAEATAVLRRTRAQVVVGFGGYVSAPAYLAGRRLGVPLIVHEANARPGLANRLGVRLGAHVAVAASNVPLPRAHCTGIPLRRAITTLDRGADRAEARRSLGLVDDAPVLLVFGGSQGARRINTAVREALPGLLELGAAVLHVHGPTAVDIAAPVPGRYVPLPYLAAMEQGYAAADLVLARAGALTCAELSAVGLGGVLVPLPIGNGEQRLNAAALVESGAVTLVEDVDLDGLRLLAEVGAVLTDRGACEARCAAARLAAPQDGDERLATLVTQVVAGHDSSGGG